ncbi:MAG: T9SS type A sorting domain-containing protein [Ignavibacteriae bacterium]|nr:T9SS type A sorting domain-containing protein [Ignavibacteriota bacterium]
MTKHLLSLVLGLAYTAHAGESIHTIPPNTKGNHIELSIANTSRTETVQNIDVRVAKSPSFMTFATTSQGIEAIAPGGEAVATFTFDTGRPKDANDTLEFQISDRSGSRWMKRIIVRYADPDVFRLEQNYPNPFNPTTTIEYQVPVQSRVSLKLYDVLGREVCTLVNEDQPAGYSETKFNAANYASGVYFYRMIAQPLTGGSAFSQLKQLVVVK